MKKIQIIWIALLFNYSYSCAGPMINDGFHGETVMKGYIVTTPCSIETDSQYQYVNYNYEFNNNVDVSILKKLSRSSITIKLNNCISEYDKNKYKGMKIKFSAPHDIYSNAIKLSGPTAGVVLYVYDTNNNLLNPNELHSISGNSIYFDSKNKSSYLRYEMEMATTSNDIEPGDYFVTIKFNISYD